MDFVKACAVSILTALTLGCTKGMPNFASLGSDDIPQPMFSGATEETLGANTPSETFSISGDCDSKIRDISGTAVGTATAFSTLTAMATSAVTVSCSTTGHFSFTLKSLADLGYAPVNGQTYDIQLRAITTGGISNPSTIHIAYSTSGGPDPKRILITSGSTESGAGPRLAVGTSFKAEIRVGNKVNNYSSSATADAMSLKTGSVYKMRAGMASQD